MDLNLDLLRLAHALANHAQDRQALISQNVANADTPGYKARDIRAFSDTYTEFGPSGDGMKATRAGHLGFASSLNGGEIVEASASGAESPNGNTVSLEEQMLKGVEVRQAHDLAMGVYSKSLDILRAGLGRNR